MQAQQSQEEKTQDLIVSYGKVDKPIDPVQMARIEKYILLLTYLSSIFVETKETFETKTKAKSSYGKKFAAAIIKQYERAFTALNAALDEYNRDKTDLLIISDFLTFKITNKKTGKFMKQTKAICDEKGNPKLLIKQVCLITSKYMQELTSDFSPLITEFNIACAKRAAVDPYFPYPVKEFSEVTK